MIGRNRYRYRYTGHGAATGGLQSHSVGELYPFDVYGQETPQGTRYGVVNLATGDATGPLWCIEDAARFARELVGAGPIAGAAMLRGFEVRL